MADKVYLDAEGVKRLKEYIDAQFETPGSIQNMIDAAINQLRIEDLEQNDSLIIDGGNAPKEGE